MADIDKIETIGREIKALVADGFKKSDEKRDANHQIVLSKFDEHDARIGVLETAKVTGDRRATASSDRAKALEATTSQHDLKLASEQSALIVKSQEQDAAIRETRAIAEASMVELSKQSDFMGVGKKGLEWLRSKEARTDIIRLITLGGVIYATLKSTGVIK